MKAYVYEVTGFIPEQRDPETKKVIVNGRHVGAFVECVSVSRAVAAFEELYTGVRIESVVAKGARVVLIDRSPS